MKMPLRLSAPLLLTLAFFAAPPLFAQPATHVVATETDLRQALATAAPEDTIVFAADITLTGDLPIIDSDLTIQGGGFTLSGDNQYRGLMIIQGPEPALVTVTIANLTIADTTAAGGTGGDGSLPGGGGAGLGGALYVGEGTFVIAEDVSILSSSAVGGSGGTFVESTNPGGGGGMGGDGGDGGTDSNVLTNGGGGGLGNTAVGGTDGDGGAGIAVDRAPGGGALNTNGGAGGGGGGSGEAGAGGGIFGDSVFDPELGGDGGFGGGGGGAALGFGGNGGFGGGGGGGFETGGFGGYGGGGGSAGITPGVGGVFGGEGGTAGGGGGAGLGGAVFIENEGFLLIANSFTISGNSVAPGSGGSAGALGAGSDGQAFGSGIFLAGSGQLSFDIEDGITSTISDDIVDETGAGFIDGGAWFLSKCGNGTLVLSGNNRYSGGTDVCEGTLQVTDERNVGSGAIFINPGATFSVTGDATFENTLLISNDSELRVADGRTVTWNGQIVDGSEEEPSFTLHVTGGGVVELTNTANSYTSGTIVGDGSTVQVSDDNALGEGGTLTLGDATGNGTLAIAAGSEFVSGRQIVLGATGGVIDTQAGSTATLFGAVTGPGGLTKTGLGTLSLANRNTAYGGATTIEMGVLSLMAASSDPDASFEDVAPFNIFSPTAPLHIGSAGTLALNGISQEVGSLTGNGLVELGTGTLTVGGSNASSLFGGRITGSGGLVKTGTGILTLTGANSYTGGTLVSDGVLLGTATSLQGNIVNNAAVVFDQNTNGTYAGDMSGTGLLVKNGGATLTLSGNNSYTGGTIVAAGTLVGTSNSLGGDILNNSAVVFDQAFNGTYAGSMSGAGALVKAGGGTLVLGQSNSHAGGTSVIGGTLRAGASNALGGNLVIGGGSSVDLAGFGQSLTNLIGTGSLSLGSATLQVSTGVFGGAISGSGRLVKTGSGTLALTGANSYTGGTTVSGGALLGTTTSLQGNIVNNALVVLDQSFDGTFNSNMTGSGALEKSGSGTVTVGGSLAHTGGTFVTGGRLVGTSASLSGTLLNDSMVTFGGNESGTFVGLLAGDGTFEKVGGGTLTLTGSHVHTGLFNVTAGVLAADGTLSSNISVGPNATLRALGTIFGTTTVDGSLVVPNGQAAQTLATLAGESTGDGLLSAPLLQIGGDLNMNPGSRLSMPVGPGPNPTVLVGGTATLNGATLDLTPATPLTERATSFLALAAVEGLNVTSTTGESSDPDLVPYLQQEDNLLFVTMLNLGIPLSRDVNSPNAKSVGEALEQFKENPTDDQLAVIRELTGLTDSELDDALRQISGEAHATFLQIGMRDSEAANDSIRRQITARRREARGTDDLGASWWGQMGGERTRLTNASGDRIGTIDIGSGMGGMDYRATDTLTFGGGAGFSGGTIGLIDLNSSGDILSPRAFGYAGWRPKSFGFKGGATFARQKMDSQRQLDFQARLPDDLGGDPIGEGIHRRAESEEVTLIKDQWTDWDDEHEINTYTISYVLGYRRATFTRRGFIESGADSLSLELPEQTVTLKQVNTLFNFWRREGDFRPFGEFLFRREMTDGRTTTVLEFPDEGDSRFFVDGEPAPKNITKIRLGSTWFLESSTWRFEYEYRRATGQTTHGGALHVRF